MPNLLQRHGDFRVHGEIRWHEVGMQNTRNIETAQVHTFHQKRKLVSLTDEPASHFFYITSLTDEPASRRATSFP